MNDVYLIELSSSYTGDSTVYLPWFGEEDSSKRFQTRDGKLLCYSTEKEAAAAVGRNICESVFFDAERLDYWLFTGSRSQIYVDDVLDADFCRISGICSQIWQIRSVCSLRSQMKQRIVI